MDLLYSLVGLFLVAAFGLVVLADGTKWFNCGECGLPYNHPRHFLCLRHGTSCRDQRGQHEYKTPARPYLFVVVPMVAVLVAWMLGFMR